MKQKLDRCFFAVTVLMAWIACIETVLTAFRGQAAAKKLSGAFIQGSDEFSTVLTVWDGGRLVGLTRVLDDTEMLAQIHDVLEDPEYQGQGIAGRMIEYIKDKYKDFLYIEGMSEDRDNLPFYLKHGFTEMERGAAIQTCNYNGKK